MHRLISLTRERYARSRERQEDGDTGVITTLRLVNFLYLCKKRNYGTPNSADAYIKREGFRTFQQILKKGFEKESVEKRA